MSHELHYTSVPRGLKPGSVGLCVVAMTAKISPHLAERMEGLSGYRAVYPPGSPMADRNPVVVSHLKFSLGSQTYHILSRVAFSGVDYSQRGNNYAHHVAFEVDDRPLAGPAWLASQRGIFDTAWTGEPRVLASGRKIPQGDQPIKVCGAWASQFGDAGWGGVLAQSFLDDPRKPAYVVFDPGQDVLSLFVEALALIPPMKRWDVTFSTYFTGQAQGLTCVWRAVLRDSPEHITARRLPDTLVLDPASAGELPTNSPLVEAARTGRAQIIPKAEPKAPPAARRATPSLVEPIANVAEFDTIWKEEVRADAYELIAPAPPTPKVYTPPPPRAPSSPASPPSRPAKPPVRSKRSEAERRAQLLMKAWIGFVALAVVALGAFTIYMMRPSPVKQVAAIEPTEEHENPIPRPDVVDKPPERVRPPLPDVPPVQPTRPFDPKPPNPMPVETEPPVRPVAVDPPPAPQPVADPPVPPPSKPHVDMKKPPEPRPEPPRIRPLRNEPAILEFLSALPGADDLTKSWTPRAGRDVKSIELVGADDTELDPRLKAVSDDTSTQIELTGDLARTGSFDPIGTFKSEGPAITFTRAKPPDTVQAFPSLQRCLLKVTFTNGTAIVYRFGKEPNLDPVPITAEAFTVAGIRVPLFDGADTKSPFVAHLDGIRLQSRFTREEMKDFKYAEDPEKGGEIRATHKKKETPIALRVYLDADGLHAKVATPAGVARDAWESMLAKYKDSKKAQDALDALRTMPAGPPPESVAQAGLSGNPAKRPQRGNVQETPELLAIVVEALKLKEQGELVFEIKVKFGDRDYILRPNDAK